MDAIEESRSLFKDAAFGCMFVISPFIPLLKVSSKPNGIILAAVSDVVP